jgi:hypothetical protein
MGKKSPTTTTKSSVNSTKVLDLFLWHSILVLVLGILGYVGKGAALCIRQLEVGETAQGFFSPAFLGLVSHLLQVGAQMWSHQTAVL